MVRIDAHVDPESMILTVIHILVQTNVASDSFHAATILSQYAVHLFSSTKFAGPGAFD